MSLAIELAIAPGAVENCCGKEARPLPSLFPSLLCGTEGSAPLKSNAFIRAPHPISLHHWNRGNSLLPALHLSAKIKRYQPEPWKHGHGCDCQENSIGRTWIFIKCRQP